MYGWWDEPGSERSEPEIDIWVLSTSVGWIMTLKMLTSSSLQSENITFCGKRDFTGGINLKVLRCFVLWAQYNYRRPLMWWLFSHWVISDSLSPHGLQHARLPCPSLSPGICSNSCLGSQWCYPTISSSVTCFSSCPQSSPASGSFSVSWLFASGGQSVGASALALVLPVNNQGWFPLGLIGLISLQSLQGE